MRINNTRVQCGIEEDAMNVEIRFQAFQAFSNIAAKTRVEIREGRQKLSYFFLVYIARATFSFFRCMVQFGATFCESLHYV